MRCATSVCISVIALWDIVTHTPVMVSARATILQLQLHIIYVPHLLHQIASHRIALYCMTLHLMRLRCIKLNHIVLPCIPLHCTASYHIALHHITGAEVVASKSSGAPQRLSPLLSELHLSRSKYATQSHTYKAHNIRL